MELRNTKLFKYCKGLQSKALEKENKKKQYFGFETGLNQYIQNIS